MFWKSLALSPGHEDLDLMLQVNFLLSGWWLREAKLLAQTHTVRRSQNPDTNYKADPSLLYV